MNCPKCGERIDLSNKRITIVCPFCEVKAKELAALRAEVARLTKAYGDITAMRAAATADWLRAFKRAEKAEAQLRAAQSAIVTAEALTMSHEGHIAKLEAENARLKGEMEKAQAAPLREIIAALAPAAPAPPAAPAAPEKPE